MFTTVAMVTAVTKDARSEFYSTVVTIKTLVNILK